MTEVEQRHVRTALLFLRRQLGSWQLVAHGLQYKWDSIQKIATGKRPVTAGMALRVARFAEVGMDGLLAGEWPSRRTCPHCGHPPDDFVDEETVESPLEETLPAATRQR